MHEDADEVEVDWGRELERKEEGLRRGDNNNDVCNLRIAGRPFKMPSGSGHPSLGVATTEDVPDDPENEARDIKLTPSVSLLAFLITTVGSIACKRGEVCNIFVPYN